MAFVKETCAKVKQAKRRSYHFDLDSTTCRERRDWSANKKRYQKRAKPVNSNPRPAEPVTPNVKSLHFPGINTVAVSQGQNGKTTSS
ncbi:hypothetical protein GBA52_011143 [Prunus armeniaca]|nr:hypothetical protein GBA52_011143 [Prunus armeniaca]